MEQELVSIIMPTYNATKHLGSSIESILNQTYTNWELLISDDASTNKQTREILNHYKNLDARIKVFFLPENLGPACTRNKSITEARGKYIAFCDSDDRWMPNKLEKQIAFMNKKDCCLSFTSYFECDENDNECGIIVAPKQITLSELKKDNKIGCLTAIYDATKHGKFLMPTIRKRQDWALFLNILKKSGTAYAIQEPLAYYRHRKDSVSTNKFSLIKYNIKVYKEIFGFSDLKATLYFLLIFMPSYLSKVVKNKFLYILYKLKQTPFSSIK